MHATPVVVLFYSIISTIHRRLQIDYKLYTKVMTFDLLPDDVSARRCRRPQRPHPPQNLFKQFVERTLETLCLSPIFLRNFGPIKLQCQIAAQIPPPLPLPHPTIFLSFSCDFICLEIEIILNAPRQTHKAVANNKQSV